jgi:hypothetical protein
MAQNKSRKIRKTKLRRSNKSRTRKIKGGYIFYPDPVIDSNKMTDSSNADGKSNVWFFGSLFKNPVKPVPKENSEIQNPEIKTVTPAPARAPVPVPGPATVGGYKHSKYSNTKSKSKGKSKR